MADTLHVNGTQIGLDDIAAPGSGYGYVRVVGLSWGTPDSAQFLDPRPLGDGKVFRGSVPQDRRFTLTISGHSSGSLAKGQDTWLAVLNLFRTNTGTVSFKYTRTDGAGGTVTRELLAVVAGELPGWELNRSGIGMRPNGNFLMQIPCLAPYPWFRSYVETDSTLTLTGSASNSVVVTRSGSRVCGVQVKVSTTGTLDAVTIQDGSRSITLTATFNSTPKGVDWYYADPSATVIDSGVVVSAPGHISLHSSSVTFTGQSVSASASGTHTIAFKHKPVWEAP